VAIASRPEYIPQHERQLYDMLKHAAFTSWSGLRILDGGDSIRTAAADTGYVDSREGSWVQVRSLELSISRSLMCHHVSMIR
jgi:hypothetical protein